MEAQFRIGGVYRQQDGQVVELSICAVSNIPTEPGTAWATGPGEYGFGYGFRSLSDGRDISAFKTASGNRDLLPGELHQVNGEWIPLAESPDTDFHRAVDRLAGGGGEEAPKRCGCQKCGGTRGGVPGNENRLNGVVLCDYCTAEVLRDPITPPKPPAPERTRPALTWATPKPFDAFKGFFTQPADMADWQDTYFPR